MESDRSSCASPRKLSAASRPPADRYVVRVSRSRDARREAILLRHQPQNAAPINKRHAAQYGTSIDAWGGDVEFLATPHTPATSC